MTSRRFAPLLKRTAMLMALAVVGLSPAISASANGETAKQLLQSIYGHYTGQNAKGVPWREPGASRYFDATLSNLIARDLQETRGELSRVGADPFVNAQDFELKNLKIEIRNEGETRARGTASFTNFRERMSVEYELVKTPQGWRISNIAWPGQEEDFRTLLMRPLEAE